LPELHRVAGLAGQLDIAVRPNDLGGTSG